MKAMKEERIDPMQGKATLTKDRRKEDHSKSGGRVAAALTVVQRDSLGERVRAMIASERLAQEAAMAGMETFEEADDFEVGDDYEPSSPYEEIFEGDIRADAEGRYAEERDRSAGVASQSAETRERELIEHLKGLDPGTRERVLKEVSSGPEG